MIETKLWTTREELAERVRAIVRPKRPKAQVINWPKPLSQMALVRRQNIIDQTWERVIAEQRELTGAEEAERRVREFVWGPGR